MTLETQIDNLAAAINRLADVFQSTAKALGETPAAPANTSLATTTASTTEKAAPKAVTPKAPAAKVAAPKAAAPAPTADVATGAADAAGGDFEAVRVAGRELAGAKGRDAVVALLAEFGATKAGDLKPEQFGPYIARAKEMVTAGDDDIVG